MFSPTMLQPYPAAETREPSVRTFPTAWDSGKSTWTGKRSRSAAAASSASPRARSATSPRQARTTIPARAALPELVDAAARVGIEFEPMRPVDRVGKIGVELTAS